MRTKIEIIQSGSATESELNQLGLTDGKNSFMDLNLIGQPAYMKGYRMGLQFSEYPADYCAN